MPIRKSERNKYPANWKDISTAIKQRAGWRCECEGECSTDHQGRCEERHGSPTLHFRGKVILTTEHLNHDPTDNRPENLKAMCQRCHLLYDLNEHLKNARETRHLIYHKDQTEICFYE